jgi:hypothetical protein
MANEATVVAEIGGQLKFKLVAENGNWFIASIERPDLEH